MMDATQTTTPAKTRRSKGISPTQRALAELKRLGLTAQVVEHWNPHARIRQDLFGCIDILALCPDGNRYQLGLDANEWTLGIQACAGASHAARKTKAMAEPRLRTWLECGNAFQIWSFSKTGDRGKRKLWTRRVESITLADLSLAPAGGGKGEG